MGSESGTAAIQQRHESDDHGVWCVYCARPWPCDAVRWKADAEALAALLRRMQAESIFTGYWRELADELVGAHEARVKEEE